MKNLEKASSQMFPRKCIRQIPHPASYTEKQKIHIINTELESR